MLSRLPKHDEKTFDNFDTSQTTADGLGILESLKTLAFIEAERTSSSSVTPATARLILPRPSGTGAVRRG